MNRRLLRLLLSLVALGASGSLVFVGACVGDDPVTSVPSGDVPDAAPSSPAPDSATPPLPDAGAPDAGGNDAAEAGPTRFCATQAPLTGVTDFFCADFDGPKLDEGFTTTPEPDGGALIPTTDIFFSPPKSVVMSGGDTLFWQKTGATAFTELDVQVRMNVGELGGVVAPSTASATLLELQSIDTNISLQYTHGASVAGTTNYTGYYLQASTCPNACALTQKLITTTLPVDVWTNVAVAWTSTGLVTISFNGVSVLSTQAFASTSTKVSTTLGVVTNGGPVALARLAFDDFIVSVKRQ